MSKNNKVVKCKVINTNIDKKFIGKDLDLQKVKSMVVLVVMAEEN